MKFVQSSDKAVIGQLRLIISGYRSACLSVKCEIRSTLSLI